MSRICEEVLQTIERGSITFLYRPRSGERPTDRLTGVQRLLILLSPADSCFERLIAIGRKRLPRDSRRDRFWGFVDLILTSGDMKPALGAQMAQMYGTTFRGLRPISAAQTFAEGSYEIAIHGGRAHLRWHVEHIARDPIAFEVQIEKDADYILTVANPDPGAWGLGEIPDLQRELFDELELHVLIPAPFPSPLRERMRNRRFTQLDSMDWLDHPGAEIVFIGAGA
jgi:hypothetical protein